MAAAVLEHEGPLEDVGVGQRLSRGLKGIRTRLGQRKEGQQPAQGQQGEVGGRSSGAPTLDPGQDLSGGFGEDGGDEHEGASNPVNRTLRLMGKSLSAMRSRLGPNPHSGYHVGQEGEESLLPSGVEQHAAAAFAALNPMQRLEVKRWRDTLVRVALAAFAVNAFLKCVLVPSMATPGHTPQASSRPSGEGSACLVCQVVVWVSCGG